MAETSGPPSARRARWPGLVWAVPLAAALIAAYLGIQAWSDRGIPVTVTFDRAAGAQAGDTKVLYQGVEAGHLVKIVPNADGRRLDFKLRLVKEAKRGLNTNARFWLIGASPNLSDLNSLKAVVSGVAIGYAPGEGGETTRRFEGLEHAPVVLPGDRGTRYGLEASMLGSIREGSSLLFHGEPIGKVSEVHFKGDSGFHLEVFVFQPYDAFIKPGARFWTASPARLSFTGGSVEAHLAPASAILGGAIDLELPPSAQSEHQSPEGSSFALYASRSAARQGLSGPAVPYAIDFPGAGGDLEEGSPVTLLGFQVGEVQSAQLEYEPRGGVPGTRVIVLIYPQALDPGHADTGTADWHGLADQKLRALIRRGYRARLRASPPLIGASAIALEAVPGVAAPGISPNGPLARIPSAPAAGDLDHITAQADKLLAKLDAVPVAAIGRNLNTLTTQLNRVAGSAGRTLNLADSRIGPLLTHLDQAVGQLSGTAHAANEVLGGAGGAQDEGLPDTLRQINEAARSVRDLTDYLDRHPEALLRGKRPEP